MALSTGNLEQLTTEQILVIYEHSFGRLEPIARGRIIAAASAHGWDRTWEDAFWPEAA